MRGGALLPCRSGVGAVCGEQGGARKRTPSRAVSRICWCRETGAQPTLHALAQLMATVASTLETFIPSPVTLPRAALFSLPGQRRVSARPWKRRATDRGSGRSAPRSLRPGQLQGELRSHPGLIRFQPLPCQATSFLPHLNSMTGACLQATCVQCRPSDGFRSANACPLTAFAPRGDPPPIHGLQGFQHLNRLLPSVNRMLSRPFPPHRQLRHTWGAFVGFSSIYCEACEARLQCARNVSLVAVRCGSRNAPGQPSIVLGAGTS